MEYERIHKVHTGFISPSKLRMMKLTTGSSSHQKKKDGSNSNSSRTSPSRLEESEFLKNSLLGSDDEQVSSIEDPTTAKCENLTSGTNQGESREPEETGRPGTQPVSKGDSSSSVHPIRTSEDESLDYDSTSSFEFHKGDHHHRPLHHSLTRSLSRPMSSKWNDAEKWIVNRHHNNNPNRTSSQNQINRPPIRVPLDSSGPPAKRVDFAQPAKFGYVSNGNGSSIDCPESKDLTEVDDVRGLSNVTEEESSSGVRSVSMRDMGTEMTPIPSQEPSRSVTPVSSTTPLRSPNCSLPSTPRRGGPGPAPVDGSNDAAGGNEARRELSEEELKLRARREIVELGVQLGKMNIAAWASKDERGDKGNFGKVNIDGDGPVRLEYARRAAAWEEAEKSKHAARFKREEIRIQAWESQQKAKLEAEMRNVEAQIVQMRAHARAKMVKKVALARQKSEEKRASVEAKKERLAEKTAAKAEHIRKNGHMPSASPFVCCGWS